MKTNAEYCAENYVAHRKERLAYQANYDRAHKRPPQYSSQRLEYHRGYLQRKREGAILVLGGKCVVCGWDDPRALQIDHVNGGGNSYRKQHGYNSLSVYNEILSGSGIEKYQLLCANHNWIKRYENNEHRRRK